MPGAKVSPMINTKLAAGTAVPDEEIRHVSAWSDHLKGLELAKTTFIQIKNLSIPSSEFAAMPPLGAHILLNLDL